MSCTYCDPATSTEIKVTLGEGTMGVYTARVRTDYRWNGWLCPAFDFKTALRVAADTHILASEATEEGDHGDIVEFASYNARYGTFIMSGGGRSVGDELVEINATSCCGRYDIGAMNWTWVEDMPELGDEPEFTATIPVPV
jgi:hypothetical protein